MSSDKNNKISKEDNQNEQKVESKTTEVQLEKKPEKKEESKEKIKIKKQGTPIIKTSEAISPPQSKLEDLPEDIKKKLEKREKERVRSAGKSKKKKKKEFKRFTIGKAFIKATYNNTIVTLADLNGNVVSWASAGIAGFKGPKKSTPYAAQIITRIAVEKAKRYGLREVSVFVKGVGTGRESAVRALNINGLNITSIKDVTPMPHNGCRPKGPRRV